MLTVNSSSGDTFRYDGSTLIAVSDADPTATNVAKPICAKIHIPTIAIAVTKVLFVSITLFPLSNKKI